MKTVHTSAKGFQVLRSPLGVETWANGSND